MGWLIQQLDMYAFTIQLLIIVFLTALTQIGGIIWLLSLWLRRRVRMFLLPKPIVHLILFMGLYTFSTMVIIPPLAKKYCQRVPLPVRRKGALQPKSIFFCLCNRHYIKRSLLKEIKRVASVMNERFPNTITYYLDVSFPFSNQFPLFPHMGHRKGTCVDLSYYYINKSNGRPIEPPSPFGYWIYESPRLGEVRPPKHLPRLNLRWNFKWFQPKNPPYRVDEAKMKTIIELLSSSPYVNKLLIETHLKHRWAIENPLVRFQGYRSARHDDHLHIQFAG